MKVLVVNAHPEPTSIYSATNAALAHLLTKLPSDAVTVLNLADSELQTIDSTLLGAFVSTVFQDQAPSDAQAQALVRVGEIVALLKAHTHLVIAMPMYNFNMPARLKDWLDNIVVPQHTFYYDEQGQPHGLMGGHKAMVIFSSGSVYSQGDFVGMDFASPYIQALLGGFLGFDEVTVVRAEGTQAPDVGAELAIERACADIDAKFDEFFA